MMYQVEGLSVPKKILVDYFFNVKDATTEQPVEGAKCYIIANLPGGGTSPHDSVTNVNGVCTVKTTGSAKQWSVQKVGYDVAMGAGGPPSEIFLIPTGGEPPTDGDGNGNGNGNGEPSNGNGVTDNTGKIIAGVVATAIAASVLYLVIKN